jgi:chromosome partitioning protein
LKVISVANQKGGVGKTVTAVTLAHGLALSGCRVLLVDMDPQGHVALSFGLPKSPGLFDLIGEINELPSLVLQARENLDILPGDKHTESVKQMLANSPRLNAFFLESIRKSVYDVVILDTAPSLDILHTCSLLASDWVIVPTRLDSLSLDGTLGLIQSLAGFSQRGHSFDGYCLLPTFFDRTTRETFLQFQALVDLFGARVWPPIPQDTRIREAPAYGRTLWEYAPNTVCMRGLSEHQKWLGGYRQVLKKLEEILNG